MYFIFHKADNEFFYDILIFLRIIFHKSINKEMTRNRILNYLIAAVWIGNGLFCKVLNLVPRHEEIVARIIGNAHSGVLTRAIGFSEMAMAVWILSGVRPKLNAITQVVVIATMNSLEFILAPDLLLWGRFNAVFAALFCLLILFNEFYFKNRQTQQL
jgi:hypothetical protein